MGNAKFCFARFRQEFAFAASGLRILPIRAALMPRSLADRVGFRIQKSIQRTLDRLSNQSSGCVRISFSSILIAPEIAFSFSCATFSMACFLIDYSDPIRFSPGVDNSL